MCYKSNCILSKFSYFLRIFELKNKYRRLAVKNKDSQNLVRQLPSCLIEKYSGFSQICLAYQKKQRKLFKPIDIIYKPTKRFEIEPLCFFFNQFIKGIFFLLFSWSKKRDGNRHIEFISVITVINFLLIQTNKNAIVKIVQKYQELLIILTTKT